MYVETHYLIPPSLFIFYYGTKRYSRIYLPFREIGDDDTLGYAGSGQDALAGIAHHFYAGFYPLWASAYLAQPQSDQALPEKPL